MVRAASRTTPDAPMVARRAGVLKCPAMVEQIGIGIIGAGNIAAHSRPGDRRAGPAGERAPAGGAGRRTAARAEKLAGAVRGRGMHRRRRDACARPDIQVVTICTPSGTHAELGLQAAAAGKHVIVEKPIDVTLERARALIAGLRATPGAAGGDLPEPVPAGGGADQAGHRSRAAGQLYLVDAYVKWFRTPAVLRGGALAGHQGAGRRRGADQPGHPHGRSGPALRRAGGVGLRHRRAQAPPLHRGGGHRPGAGALPGRGGRRHRGHHLGGARVLPAGRGARRTRQHRARRQRHHRVEAGGRGRGGGGRWPGCAPARRTPRTGRRIR